MFVFETEKPIAIGCDHAGFDRKSEVIEFLEEHHLPFKDFGTYSKESVDYPDFAHPVSLAVESGNCSFGILLCGSANGVAITANKHAGIRAAICWNIEITRLARLHNDANVICIPARFVQEGDCRQMVETFMNTTFEGGRHQNRVKKIDLP